MDYNEEIEIRSEELKDIIGKRPTWIIRFGITVIFIIVVILITLSYIIKFPSVISSRVVVTTRIPPFSIVSRASGRIKLFCKEDEEVSKGQLLGGIENSSKFDDVFSIKKQLKSIKKNFYSSSISNLPHYNLNDSLNLGELQMPYLNLMKGIENLKVSNRENFNDRRLKILSLQLKNYQKMGERNTSQDRLHDEDEGLVKKRLKVDSILLARKVISRNEYELSKRNYYRSRMDNENAKSTSIGNLIELSRLQSQILEMESSRIENEKNLNIAVKEAIEVLEVQVDLWERKYLFYAPNAGTVNVIYLWTDDQLVINDQEVMRVVPRLNTLYSKAMVPVSGSGKLAVNQQVNIKFDNFLFTEYGMVKGRVKSISQVPINGNYSVIITLPKGLMTTYGKQLPFKQEMEGSAEIVTSSISILGRIFNQLQSIFDQLNQKN